MKRLLVFAAACGGNRVVETPLLETKPQVVAAEPASPRYEGPPIAGVKNVRDTYHGVAVDDPYRWLEGNDSAVVQWTAGQNTYARKILEALPEIDALRAEVTAIVRAPLTNYWGVTPAGGRLFAMRKQPTKEQSELIVIDDPAKAADARLVFDPTAGGVTTRSIDWFVPSPDGARVAVSISDKGSEAGDLHILDLDGKTLDTIPNVQHGTGGGDVAWAPDGKGVYYTRYPRGDEKPHAEREFWMQLWFHAIGSPASSDRYELGRDLPKIAEIRAQTDRKGRVLASVQNGDGGEFRFYLRDVKGAWRQLSDWQDEVKFAGFSATDDLWLVSTKDAPRGKVLLLPAGKPLARAKLVIPQGRDTIETSFWGDAGVVDAGDRIYLTYQVGGPTELRAFTKTGKPAKAPVLPPVASTGTPIVAAGGVIVTAGSYTTPRAFYRFDPRTGKTTTIDAMSPKPPVDLSSLEPIREAATSKDGTKVPFTVLWPKGAPRDGSRPCLVTGYGGYGLSEKPGYWTVAAPLVTRGVCLVLTNLRGGREFGEDWHRAGMLTKKQNVFDDFAAVLEKLAADKYSQPARLAIMGGSNGGLLMGAMLAQHPDKVKVVVAQVGIFDSVRAEQSSNGEYNVTEFGTVKDKAQFDAIYAYSPYHRIKQARYPAVLLTAGENDVRVPIWHSRKMTAALQAAQTGDAPILLRTSATAGHGAGTAASERIEDLAQIWAFVLAQVR